jgi:hypothetical protein
MACSSLLGLGQIAFAFWASFIGNCICVLSQIFLYSYIIKASPRVTPYHLKGKKGSGALGRLIALKTMVSSDGHKRILRYLRSTPDYGLLRRSRSTDLVVYTDADWAGCPDTRRSTSGYAVFLGDNLVS